ncbi:MAG TPA: penicillin acylase family protein [Thermoanaerobaculia bacterium]|nr:penicillin acylase family protein [Thermoanaerobaculia bacterium]
MSSASASEPSSRRRPMARRLARGAILVVAAALVVAIALIVTGWLLLRASLPIMEGELVVPSLEAPVSVERDPLGVPTIRAASRADAACALGFLHAQERFFQMDLLRRQPAGELAELFGPRALESDRTIRIHRFRERARRIVAASPPRHRTILEAYAAGVNEGLRRLRARPFEYLVLRADPQPWRPEDSVLVVHAMYLDLQDEDGSRDSSYGVLRDTMPPEMFAFLTPRGSEWDAPIDGSTLELPAIPGPDVFDLRKEVVADRRVRPRGAGFQPAPAPRAAVSQPSEPGESDLILGSNNFAVGAEAAGGRALLAGDMHLGIDVPIIWYRASIAIPGEGGAMRRMTGVTLPGTPLVVAGSNGAIAWAFTNSYGDWVDLVVLDEAADGTYRTGEGWRRPELVRETIRAKGGEEEVVEIEETIWGPVIDEDHLGRRRALQWVGHAVRGAEMGLLDLEGAGTIDEAMDVANRSAIPAQNVVVADRDGRIGWTIVAAVPRRPAGYDRRLPVPAEAAWSGWLDPEELPRITDPPGGRIWTANARVVGGAMLETIGDGGYPLGARARQIRDALKGREIDSEEDLLAIQLDDRALFLARWQALMLEVLGAEAIADDPRRKELREVVEGWGARAAAGSAGYRVVRAWRAFLEEEIFAALTRRAASADPRFRWRDLAQREHALWALVTERPVHLLDPKYGSWDEQLLATADRVLAELTGGGRRLASRTWGERNASRFRHPLAGALPIVGRFLEYPRRRLPGDWDMPRVQTPFEGASQRMVVSPGDEARGIFHMPGGQSGHPLSPHFADGHEAWVEGRATPFLPSGEVRLLRMVP